MAADAVVPVFIADHGLDAALVGARRRAWAFPALMVDTADKHAGSLFDCVPVDELRSFVGSARAAGALVGLAGALRVEDLPLLRGTGARLRRLSQRGVRRRPQRRARPAATVAH